MSQIRNRLSLSALLVALAGAFPSPEAGPVPIRLREPLPDRRKQAFKKMRHGNSVPHQSKRECARRRGGKDWADWKSADRVSRGLPA